MIFYIKLIFICITSTLILFLKRNIFFLKKKKTFKKVISYIFVILLVTLYVYAASTICRGVCRATKIYSIATKVRL